MAGLENERLAGGLVPEPGGGLVVMTELALGTDLSTEQREYLDIVKASGESLLTVINDILDFSKIEAGQLTVDVIPFDVGDCLATTLKLLATRAHVKGLELAYDIRPDVPTALMGDPGRLRRVDEGRDLPRDGVVDQLRGVVALGGPTRGKLRLAAGTSGGGTAGTTGGGTAGVTGTAGEPAPLRRAESPRRWTSRSPAACRLASEAGPG